MKRISAVLAILVLLLGAALLAACGGGDDADSPTPASETPTEATEEPENGAAEQPDDGAQTGEEDGLDPLTSLRERASAFENEAVRIVYRIEGESPTEGGPFSGTLDFAQKPPKARFAIQMEADPEELDGLPGEFVMIVDEDAAYFCGEGECLKFAGQSEQANGPMDLVADLSVGDIVEEIAAQDEDIAVRRVDDRTIAGHPSECYEVESAIQGSGIICVTKEHNIFSYLEGEFEGERVKFELVEFSQSVPDDLFEPPFPVTEFSFGTPESDD